MTPILQLILALAVLIPAAKIGGLISRRFNQPSVLGELLAGVLLGPTVFNFLHLPFFDDPHLPETVDHLAEIGVLLLMFFAGLEIDLPQLLRTGRVALLAGTLGVIAPLLFGTLAALPFGYELSSAMFIGVVLTATSVSISAQTLMELRALKTRPGMALLGAAVVDDVLSILVLSLFIAFTGGAASTGIGGMLWVIVKMALYLFVSVSVGIALLPRLAERVQHMPVLEGLLAFVVVAMFLFAWSAEALGGVAAITGAFIAGAAFAQSHAALRHRIAQGVRPLAYGFFVPLFFVGIGLETDVGAISAGMLPFLILILIVAIASKVIGCALAGIAGGFDRREALQLGVGMISRGEVGLVIASVGLERGLIGGEIFAMTVVIVLITTLVTPVLLRMLYRDASPAAQDAVE